MIPIEVYQQTIIGFLSPVREFMEDPQVTEIMINGPDEIYIERSGKLSLTNCRFDPEELMSAILNIAQFQGVSIDEHNPILEARLPDGSRVEAILPPAASDGPCVAIRRFSEDKLTMQKLIEYNSLSVDASETLRILVECKQNIIVAGGTGSGKTSMLNALSSFIPDEERTVVIEDAKELQLQGSHVVQLEVQKPDARGRGRVTTADLFRATLRMRPDRIIVGEIRGGEALELIQAMTSGHGGCMSTVHATYPTDTLNRLETMALMSEVELPLFALRAQIASAIDLIVQTSRLRGGMRCVTHITEVNKAADSDKGYVLQDIFVRKFMGYDEKGQLISHFVPTGVLPECTATVHDMGMRFPKSIYPKAV